MVTLRMQKKDPQPFRLHERETEVGDEAGQRGSGGGQEEDASLGKGVAISTTLPPPPSFSSPPCFPLTPAEQDQK